MNHFIKEELENRAKDIDDGDKKKLKIDLLGRLIDKLENDEHSEIEQGFASLVQQLSRSPINRATQKSFRKSLRSIQKQAKTAFGYVEKGSVVGSSMALGVALGVSLGITVFGSGEPGSGIGIGVGVGIAIGVGLGSAKEKKLEKQGLLY
ncbi:MAG: hypothetical protein AAGA85_22525 [Bacteroidota bacterium]